LVAFESSHHFFDLVQASGHFFILRLPEHTVLPVHGRITLAVVGLHSFDDNVSAIKSSTERGVEIATSFVQCSLHESHDLGRVAKHSNYRESNGCDFSGETKRV
jgi:hypothetical protein